MCESRANTELEPEFGMSSDKQLVLQFFEQFDNFCLGSTNCQAHVCMQRVATANPVVNTFCKSELLCRGCLALRICADKIIIIIIERGADWVRNFKTRYIFLRNE